MDDLFRTVDTPLHKLTQVRKTSFWCMILLAMSAPLIIVVSMYWALMRDMGVFPVLVGAVALVFIVRKVYSMLARLKFIDEKIGEKNYEETQAQKRYEVQRPR